MKLKTILIAALLVAPVLSTGVGALFNQGINDRQDDAIEAGLGPDAVKAPWKTFTEETVFYLHSTAPDSSSAALRANNDNTGDGYPDDGSTEEGELLFFDTRRPTVSAGIPVAIPTPPNHETVVVGGNGAYATFNAWGWHDFFTQPTKVGDWQNLSILRFQAAIYANYVPTGTLALDMHVQHELTGVRIDHNTVTAGVQPLRSVTLNAPPAAVGTGPVPYTTPTGGVVLDMLDGYKVPANHVISFDVRAGQTQNIYIDRSQYPSSITVLADSARLSWWSEDRFGQLTDTFPSGIKDQTEDTRIRFKLLHSNMFGNEDCTGDNGRSLQCQYDNIDQRIFQLRFRNLNTGQLFPIDLGRGLVGGDPGQDNLTAECCNNDFHLIKYTNLETAGYAGVGYFEYEIVYNETFPDGSYAIEFRDADPINLHWEDRHIIHIGGAGFVLEPAQLELAAGHATYVVNQNGNPIVPLQLIELNHTVAVGERTDFRLTIRNTGTTTDTIGLSVPVPGQGWQATVHPTLVDIPAGQSQDVRVAVTPSPTALVGDWKAVNVVASSLRDDDTQSMRLNTTLTSQELYGVLLLSPEGLVEVNPTLPVRFPATIVNLGTVEDTFVVTTAGFPPGWTVQVDPPIVTAYAKSAQDFIVTVTAPPEAVGGTSFPLILRATRNADAAVFDELIIPVNVIHRERFDVIPYLPRATGDIVRHDLRDLGDSIIVCNSLDPSGVYCFVGGPEYRLDDLHFDDSQIFRLRLENQGSREDTYRLSASWVPPSSGFLTNDRDSACDGSNNGVPDGWRFRILPTEGVTNPIIASIPGGVQRGTDPDSGATVGFSGDMRVAEIVLGAGQQMEFFVEMKWVAPSPDPNSYATCGEEFTDDFFGAQLTVNARGTEPSPAAGLRLTTRSTLDDTKVNVKYLVVDAGLGRDDEIDNDGHHGGFQAHSVDIEPQLGQDISQRFAIGTSSVFQMRAINTGNEFDELLVSIGEELPGWTHSISDWTVLPVSPTTAGGSSHPQTCEHATLPGGGVDVRTLRCAHVGSFDEIHFNVTATPPAGITIGQRDLVKVQVDSKGKAGLTGIFDTVRLESIVTGPYLMEVEELNQVLKVSKGNTAAFPFSIHNIGLEPDTYELTKLTVAGTSNAAWNATLSSGVLVGVPAGKSHHGFLSVVAPDTVSPGQIYRFEVQVRSVQGGNQVETLVFLAEILDETPDLILESDPVTLLQGQIGEFRVRALANGEARATFTIQNATLPDGWELVCQTIGGVRMPAKCQAPFDDPTQDIRNFQPAEPFDIAEARFFMKVPPGELSTSRVALRVAVNTTSDIQYHDVELNLATVYGVSIDTIPVSSAQGGNVGIVAPGQAFTHTVRVTNTGLSTTIVRLSNTAVPQDWTLVMDQTSVTLLPGMSREFGIVVTAPLDAAHGEDAAVRIFATPLADPTKQASVELVTTIGFYDVGIDGTDSIRFIGPQEEATFQLAVTNGGNVPDTMNVTLRVPPEYEGMARFTFEASTCDFTDRTNFCRLVSMEPDATRVVNARLNFTGSPLPGGTKVPITATVQSVVAPALLPDDPGRGNKTSFDVVQVQMLAHRGLDVDGDGLLEWAIDRDQLTANGYEQFRENRFSPGIVTTRPDLSRFLTDEGRKGKMVEVTDEDGDQVEVFVYRIDGDDDGFEDHFLDLTGDGIPDRYWDPDLGRVTVIEVTKDVTLDGVPELFLDFDNDGRLDRFFDLTLGKFGMVFPRIINGDEFIDYVVDSGDGIAGNTKAFNKIPDEGEPILLGGPGGIGGIFLKRDVDGDGIPDEVYKVDDPSVCPPSGMYFVPAGGNPTTDRYCITLEDRNGDGRLDWVFDADGDGKADSWYDPHNDKSHLLDPRSDFVKGLQKYWYIGAIFGLVLVLFVVLVAVTRR